MYVGDDYFSGQKKYISESGLYQNILVTGTIGSGKTSSIMYPFSKQLLEYMCYNNSEKLGMLILDVKGVYHKQISEFAKHLDREEDLIVIELGKSIKYNPLHKPNLKPIVLADRLSTILSLFANNTSDSYWLEKVSQVLTECIKFCRLYNNGYVTFSELHKLVNEPIYYKSKISYLKNLFQKNLLNENSVYDLLSSLDFFETEFSNLDSKVLSIIKSEVNRITLNFISDYEILKTFSPKENELTFTGFEDVIQNGKIVILNMNIAEYKNLSKIIAAYLKLDFQSEILSNISKSKDIRKTAFICDEFQEYVTSSDADFFSESREAKCINIVATQSYSSLANSLKNEICTKVILQNLINKFWFRTDDIFTIEQIQKQIGKEEKERISKSISENAKETNYDYFTNTLKSKNSSLSESINTFIQPDFIYDTNFFTQNLETFSCLTFISDGQKILPPCKIKTKPYFKSS